MKYKAGFNPENPEEYVVSITGFPEETEFNVQAITLSEEIAHIVVTTNAFIKNAQFSYDYHKKKEGD